MPEQFGEQQYQLGAAHARHDPAQEVVQGLRMPLRQAFEILARHADEITAFQCAHGGGTRLAGQQCHLADDATGAEFIEQRRGPIRVLGVYAEAAAQDQVDLAVGIALLQQAFAGGNRYVVHHAAQIREHRRGKLLVEAVIDEQAFELGGQLAVGHCRDWCDTIDGDATGPTRGRVYYVTRRGT